MEGGILYLRLGEAVTYIHCDIAFEAFAFFFMKDLAPEILIFMYLKTGLRDSEF
jgi:hypothetical protein